jgi:hypothetical protein
VVEDKSMGVMKRLATERMLKSARGAAEKPWWEKLGSRPMFRYKPKPKKKQSGQGTLFGKGSSDVRD